MTYKQLKDFCDTLNDQQLEQEVYLSVVDSHAEKVASALITDKDEYFDHTDPLGTLDQIKEVNPDDWEDVIADATLCPKGTVMLVNE